MNESDPRSNVHYLGSSENKAWKKSEVKSQSIVRAINEGLTLETSGFKLFTVVNLRFQLSW